MYRFVVWCCAIASLITGNGIISGEKFDRDFIRIPLTKFEHHSRVRRAVAGANGNKLDLWNDKNIHYGFNITIGTPPQPFVMNMDTGSSDIWVPSVDCQSKYLCQAINKYNANASSTQKAPSGDRNFKIKYAVGALTGLIDVDIIKYGGMTLKDQRFAEAKYEPTDSYNYPFDGTFGFGFAQISNSDKESTPIDNLFAQGQIKKKIFCIHLNQLGTEPGGELIIGGCDVEAETWLELTRPNVTWQTSVDSVNIVPQSPNNGKGVVCGNGCNVLFDTGSSVIGGQKETLDAIGLAVGAPWNETHDEYLIACNNGKIDDPKTLPALEFNFGTFKAIMDANDYVTPYYGDLCRLGVQRIPSTTFDGLLLGDPFLRSVSVIFDKENIRVGLAKRK